MAQTSAQCPPQGQAWAAPRPRAPRGFSCTGRAPTPRSASKMIRDVRQHAGSKNAAFDFGGVKDLRPGSTMAPSYGSPPPNPDKGRRAGIVLHPTSLPGPYGTGDMGPDALKFVDWLAAAGMQAWQVLPLVPPERQYWSPYSGEDGLCGNTLLINLELLVKDGLLAGSDLPPALPEEDASGRALKCDFEAAAKIKDPLLAKAARKLVDGVNKAMAKDMAAWRKANAWVEDSAVFHAISTQEPECIGKDWWDWEPGLRDRKPETMTAVKEKYRGLIDEFVAKQFLFYRQWARIRQYANSKGIKIIGDMPIYVGGNSADVWAYADLFELGPDRKPLLVSGVPPDAFSETGQLWGSPLYDWQAHDKDGYRWWVRRMRQSLEACDELRVDHFRGFAGYWAVEATRETAMIGEWKAGPGTRLFEALRREVGEVPILAEDLGVITPDVHELRNAIGAPGMVVLQFAWGGGPTNTHLPHNHYENCFAYPGTHDNDTTVGWWKRIPEAERIMLRRYLGTSGDDIAWELTQACFASVARTAIVCMQDVMRLDNEEGRMNTPGTKENNWRWRMGSRKVLDRLAPEARALRRLAYRYDRLAPGTPSVADEGPLEASVPVNGGARTAAAAGRG